MACHGVKNPRNPGWKKSEAHGTNTLQISKWDLKKNTFLFPLGIEKLPPPVTDFHALFVSDSEVKLAWEPVQMADKEAAVDHYEIYFKELKNSSNSGSPFDHESVRIFLILKLFICNHCESHIYHIVNWMISILTCFLVWKGLVYLCRIFLEVRNSIFEKKFFYWKLLNFKALTKLLLLIKTFEDVVYLWLLFAHLNFPPNFVP